MKFITSIFISVVMGFLSTAAIGQTNRLIVPFGPSGSSDQVARALLPLLNNELNKNFVVANMPGGNTKVAINHILHQPADGNTLLMVASYIFLNPAQYKNPGFKITDFDFATPFGYTPIVLAVKHDSAIKTWEDFIQHARTNKVNCGVHGEAPKFVAQLLMKNINAPDLQMVNFRAYGDHMAAMLSGNIECGLATKQEFMNMHTQNRIRIIATSSPTELKDLPKTKLFKEIDTNLTIVAVYSVGLLSTTPDQEKKKVLVAIRKVVTSPEFQSSLQSLGIDLYSDPVTVHGQQWAMDQFRRVEHVRTTSGVEKVD